MTAAAETSASLAAPGKAGHWLRAAIADWLPPLALGAAALGAWEGAARAFDVPRWLLPPPSVIFAETGRSFGLLMGHAGTTLLEVLTGFRRAGADIIITYFSKDAAEVLAQSHG